MRNDAVDDSFLLKSARVEVAVGEQVYVKFPHLCLVLCQHGEVFLLSPNPKSAVTKLLSPPRFHLNV